MKIGIIGAGYVGLLTGTVLAFKNPQKDFVVVDVIEQKINDLRNGNYYINEPGFKEIFEQLKNIELSSKYESLRGCDVIFIAVCTPDQNGKCNLTFFNDAIEKIKENVLNESSIGSLKSSSIGSQGRSSEAETVSSQNETQEISLKNQSEETEKISERDEKKRISLIVKSTVPVGTTKSLKI